MGYVAPKTFKYEQTVASDVWEYDYVIPGAPVVDVAVDVDGTLVKIIPTTIERLTEHSIRVTFSSPRTGWIRVII
jgi:pantothenate kinase